MSINFLEWVSRSLTAEEKLDQAVAFHHSSYASNWCAVVTHPSEESHCQHAASPLRVISST
jgi:hypothetical protein